MIQKLQRTLALSFSAFALVTYVTALAPAPAHAFGPKDFVVGLAKTMVNIAQEPFEILLLPFELADKDDTPSVTTKTTTPAATTTTTTTTTTTKP